MLITRDLFLLLTIILTLADYVILALNLIIRGNYAIPLAYSSFSTKYISLLAILQGSQQVDRYTATLLILQNQFCKLSIRSLNTTYLFAQYNISYIILRSSKAIIYLTTADAIKVSLYIIYQYIYRKNIKQRKETIII